LALLRKKNSNFQQCQLGKPVILLVYPTMWAANFPTVVYILEKILLPCVNRESGKNSAFSWEWLIDRNWVPYLHASNILVQKSWINVDDRPTCAVGGSWYYLHDNSHQVYMGSGKCNVACKQLNPRMMPWTLISIQ